MPLRVLLHSLKSAPLYLDKPMPKSPDSKPGPQTNSMTICDDTLRQFAGYNVKRASNIIVSDLTQKLKPLKLKLTTFSALVLIVDNPGSRQSQLADALSIERPNFVVVIDELERRALITRERDKKDRRAYSFTATLTGRHLNNKALKIVQAHENELLDGVSDEQFKQLVSTLQLVESNRDSGKEG